MAEPLKFMNSYLFLSLLFLLQSIYWYIGRRSSLQVKNSQTYFLAEKKVTFFPLMMTFLATQVGGGLVLGSADEAYHHGWIVLLYPLGACLGMIFLGLATAKRLTAFPVSTVAQILEVAYGSSFLKKIASMLSIVSLFMILVGQIVASHKFLIAIQSYHPLLFALFWLIVILYTVRGGLLAVISTDIAQALVFSFIFLLSFGFLWMQNELPSFALSFSSFSLGSSKFLGWLLMPLLYMVIEQDMGQRCFAANSAKTVSKAAIWAGIFTFLISIIPIVFGIFAKKAGILVGPGASILMTAMMRVTPSFVSALVGCAILAAIISTVTSLINAISSNLSQDFDWIRKGPSDSLKRIQSITFVLSLMAILASFFLDQILSILIESYALFVSVLFAPIFIALFQRKGSFLSALISMILGFLGFFIGKIFPIPLISEIGSILLSFVGFGICELWLKRKVLVKRTL